MLAAITFSCSNQNLWYGSDTSQVRVQINWKPELVKPLQNGMRINLFALDGNPCYGVDDIHCDGCVLTLPNNTCHRTLTYSYFGNNIYFRNESDMDLIEAYCSPMTRATYSRAYPTERTVAEPQGVFYVGGHPSFDVLENVDDQVIELEPDNVLYEYTFELRNVQGAQFIRETRGAISGMSSSYFIHSGTLADQPATVLFNATKDAANNKITGSFKTFGRLNATNDFTIEVLYPSQSGGILQETWNVTPQISNGTNFHIVIDANLVIPYEGGDSSGFDAIVNDWNDVTVPLD